MRAYNQELKSHLGRHNYKNSFTSCTFKLSVLSKKVSDIKLSEMSFHAVVVFGIDKDLLFNLVLGCCDPL